MKCSGFAVLRTHAVGRRERSSMHTAQRLLRRIHNRYQTVTEQVTIAGMTFPFVRIADPDVVLDQVAAEETRLEKISGRPDGKDHLNLPYWAELWDSAEGVA